MRNPSSSPSFRTFRLPNFLGSKREELSQASVSQEDKQGKGGISFLHFPEYVGLSRRAPSLSFIVP